MFLFLKNSNKHGPEIDLKKYETGINDAVVKSTVETNTFQIIDFCLQNLKIYNVEMIIKNF